LWVTFAGCWPPSTRQLQLEINFNGFSLFFSPLQRKPKALQKPENPKIRNPKPKTLNRKPEDQNPSVPLDQKAHGMTGRMMTAVNLENIQYSWQRFADLSHHSTDQLNFNCVHSFTVWHLRSFAFHSDHWIMLGL